MFCFDNGGVILVAQHKEHDIISILALNSNFFRTKELNEQGINDYAITKLVAENILKKTYQGVYQLVDSNKIKLTDINVIVENGIISMTSAAFYYNLTDGETGYITVTLNRDQKPPKMPESIFNYYYTTSSLYSLGLQVIDQNGHKIKIYDIERTVCDIIKHRTKYEVGFANSILENYINLKQKDMVKLFDYAKKMRVYNTIITELNNIGGYHERLK